MYQWFDNVDHMLTIEMNLFPLWREQQKVENSAYSQVIIITTEGEKNIGFLNDSKIVLLFICQLVRL